MNHDTTRAARSDLVTKQEAFIRAFNLQPMIDRAMHSLGDDPSPHDQIYMRLSVVSGYAIGLFCEMAISARHHGSNANYTSLLMLAAELPPDPPLLMKHGEG